LLVVGGSIAPKRLHALVYHGFSFFDSFPFPLHPTWSFVGFFFFYRSLSALFCFVVFEVFLPIWSFACCEKYPPAAEFDPLFFSFFQICRRIRCARLVPFFFFLGPLEFFLLFQFYVINVSSTSTRGFLDVFFILAPDYPDLDLGSEVPVHCFLFFQPHSPPIPF